MADAKLKVLLKVADSLLVLVLFGPLVVAYWRGSWVLLDIYLFPHDPEKTAWTSFMIGAVLTTAFYFLQSCLTCYASEDQPLVWLVVSHLHTYVHGWGIVNYWRGVWLLLNHYTTTSIDSSLVSFALGIGLLALLRSSRNVRAPPGLVCPDWGPPTYECTTRFRTKMRCTELHVLDTLFTSIVVGGLIVFYWRGSWTYMDNVLFPDNKEYSGWASLGIGYGAVLVAFLSQWSFSSLSTLLDGKLLILKVVLEDLYMFVLNTGCVCVWRGVWLCCDVYIWPNQPESSNWFTHGVGLGVLMLFGVGNSVIVRGCQIDGEFTAGEGIIPPVDYLAYILQWRQEKREHKEKIVKDVNGSVGLHAYDNEAAVTTISDGVVDHVAKPVIMNHKL